MAVVEARRDADEWDARVENTHDVVNVKGVFSPKPHSRNTIVGLSLLGLSLIFKGQHSSKTNHRMTRCSKQKGEHPPRQCTRSIEKIYQILPISLGDSAFVVGS
jgi:hypothetical protein